VLRVFGPFYLALEYWIGTAVLFIDNALFVLQSGACPCLSSAAFFAHFSCCRREFGGVHFLWVASLGCLVRAGCLATESNSVSGDFRIFRQLHFAFVLDTLPCILVHQLCEVN